MAGKTGTGSQWGGSVRSGVSGGNSIPGSGGRGERSSSLSDREREIDASPWVSAVLWASLHALPKVCHGWCRMNENRTFTSS